VTVLKLHNIQKSFTQGGETFFVLKDVNFNLNKGEVVALIGPSGSGKTTFLQISGLLDSPTSGVVSIDGILCDKLSENYYTKLRRNKIGYIYQFHHLLPEFNALENIVIPQLIRGLKYDEAANNAKQILETLGLGNRHNNIPSELSGGEQQRVAIARAMVNSPALILADEPTGNLDHHNAEKVIELLFDQVRKRNLSTIIVTHNLEIAKKADRIISIQDGVITEVTGEESASTRKNNRSK
jgi:lipoprotein-releasing system ATP-binding protein